MSAELSDDSPTQRVVEYINRTHDTDFTLKQRLAGGFQNGAYALRSSDGSAAVLKWTANRSWARQVRRARPVIAAARAAGWPTPAWLLVGTTPSGYPYEVQEYAEGSQPDRVTRQLAQAALPMLDLQAGLRPDTEHDWAAYDHAVVFADESGFTSTVAAFSVAGAEFVETMRSWAAPYQGIALPDTDLVHGDLNPGNVFLVGDRISAVVDAEALGKGSRFHDLATLMVYAQLWDGEPGACTDLLAYADEHAAFGELEVTFVSCLLGLLAFLTERNPDRAGRTLPTATEMLRRFPRYRA